MKDNKICRIIYGAGDFGTRFLNFAKGIGGEIDLFCQTECSDNKIVNGIRVISLNELWKIAKRATENQITIYIYIAIADPNVVADIYQKLSHRGASCIKHIYDVSQFLLAECKSHDIIEEQYISRGNDNPGKKFFIVRREADDAGLFSYYLSVLGGISEAIHRSMIPVVDMQSVHNAMMSDDKIGKENAWEYFFLQPGGYTLSDISNSQNIIYGQSCINYQWPDCENEIRLRYWRSLAHEFIKIRPEIKKKIDLTYSELCENNSTLGVLIRGTDYIVNKPYLHPIQPNVQMVVDKCKEFINKHTNIKRIFIATEDENIYQEFIKAFPEGFVVSYQKQRYKVLKNEWINTVANLTSDPKTRNIEYFITIGILSKCDYLISGITSGEQGALLLSDGYKDSYIFHLGRYSV